MKRKLLFLIHDLGQGGAEKVLINLVNNMDNLAFDITVMTLFDSGENRQFISPKIKYKTWCSKMIPGNSHLMKLLSPTQLHYMIIKEYYDIEVAYLEVHAVFLPPLNFSTLTSFSQSLSFQHNLLKFSSFLFLFRMKLFLHLP